MIHSKIVKVRTATAEAPLCPVCGETMGGSGQPAADSNAPVGRPFAWVCSVSAAEHAQRKPLQGLVDNARNRAKKRGTAFDEEFMRSMAPLPCCEKCGEKFTNGNTGKGGKGKGQSNTSRTLDEIVHGYGYVPGNVAQLCNACNQKKNSHTVESARELADWIEQRRDQLGIGEWT